VRFVDSHLHLEEPALGDIALAGATWTLLLACGVDRQTSQATLGLADSNPEHVRAFVGVHPSEAVGETSLGWLGPSLERASGLGEVGLDPKYSPIGPESSQVKVLLAQLEAAQAARKPVQIHSRNAERECLDALARFSLGPVLMHWFQAEPLAVEAFERGYFISFGPSLLYSKKLQRVAAGCPHAQALTETDSPVPFGPLGGCRGPSLVPSVVFKLAELWGERFEDARATVVTNAVRFLGTPEKG
jgi:TatD DNase family protein